MNKEKLINYINKRIDYLSDEIKEHSQRIFELENWLEKIENGNFDNDDM